jgi:hypothetical protein
MTTTTTKQPAVSTAPPSPPCSLQEDSSTSAPEIPAVETDKDVLDAFKKQAELASNEPAITPDEASDSIPILNPPEFDFLNALMLEEGQEQDKRKPLTKISIALLEQNKYLIDQLVEQNKHTINRLVAPPLPPLPPLTLCVACEAAGQESGGIGKKKSKSRIPNVHLVVRRTLRILAVMLLVVIAVQLGSIRGMVLEERNVKKAGFFGR